MILYKATSSKDKFGNIFIKFREFEVESETKYYYKIKKAGIFKLTQKIAKHPFASQTKTQALETLIHRLEGFKFADYPVYSAPALSINSILKAAKKELKTLEA